MNASVVISSHDVAVVGTTLHYLEAGPARPTIVLLLHGERFTSETWQTLGTITTLANAGCHVVAVDLPGYGYSAPTEVPRDEYLARALDQLWPTHQFVVVSPSMSGRFSFPFVLTHPDRVAGYVPVAPVGIEDHLASLERVSVPALVVWGADDPLIPASEAPVLAGALNGTTLILTGAGHPCYLDRPDEFHRGVVEFVQRL